MSSRFDHVEKAEKSYKEKHIQFRTSEDCLYLNGYSPADKKNKLPVCKPLVKPCDLQCLLLILTPKPLNCF